MKTLLRHFRRFIGHFLWALLSLMITIVIVFGAIYSYMEFKLPDVSVLKDVHMQVPLRVYTREGDLIAQYGAMRRVPVKFEQVPKQLVHAILATEDARYYSHPGVDFIGIIRAFVAVVSSGRKVQGASTITMQVARNFFLTRKKTYKRKINEILLALKIDQTLSKQKVLELYLNKVYFGNRAYGVAAAASVYYGKPLSKLTLPQMAMIAGLPQAPSRNNPLNNKKNALKRRNHVLKRMLIEGYIDKKTYRKAIKAPITATYHGEHVVLRAPYIAEMVRQIMVAMYGKTAYDGGFKVYTTISARLQKAAIAAIQSGLIAYSRRHGYRRPAVNLGFPSDDNRLTWEQWLQEKRIVAGSQRAAVLSLKTQQASVLLGDGSVVVIPWSGMSYARPALRDGYVGPKPTNANQILSPGDVIYVKYLPHKKRWQLMQMPKVQGALVSMNPQTGAILALRGGFNFGHSHFNRALQAERQPGSSFKPFVYSAALAKGLTLASIINDAPVVMKDTGENNWWRPQNDNFKFYGPTRLRVGLTKSRNLVSVRILQAIGIPYALQYVKRFGINTEKLPSALSLALGSGVLTPLQIAMGYSVFANGGYHVKPFFIDKIVGQQNKIIYQEKPSIACAACITDPSYRQTPTPDDMEPAIQFAPRVISSQNAYLMTQAMRGVIQSGTGRAAKVLRRTDLAGKTGTTNHRVDGWFSGFNSHVLATVWVGFDNSAKSLHEYGSRVALPIWIQFMRQALLHQPEATMPQPPDIITARIDPKNGLLAVPGQRRAIFEEFRKEYVPKTFSSMHQQNKPQHAAGGDTGGDNHIF